MDTEQKYRRLDQASPEEIAALTEQVNGSPWRQSFHIQPVTGLLNDPNGFSYYEGKYHLFYQWFPLGTYHGLKYWYHTTSTDLAFWKNEGIAIDPKDHFDSHGAYSGSGIVKDNELYLMYTGNTRDREWIRHPFQCLAVMDKHGNIAKHGLPVIDHVPEGFTEHFRDPKVWKDDDSYRCVIGAQRQDLTGAAVVYKSPDLLNWQFCGEIKTSLEKLGFMWECPDYFEMDGQGVFLFSPQGLSPNGDNFQNLYQSGYLIGKPLNRDTLEFEHGSFQELDRGFDFYAPQTMIDGKGRRILVAWMGLPEIDYPTDSHGWAHCLTLPRELKIHNGKLIQQPVIELQKLRGQPVEVQDTLKSEVRSYKGVSGVTYELVCEFLLGNANAVGIEIRANETERTIVRFDTVHKKVTMDRTESGDPIGSEFGTTRSCRLESESIKFHLFVDISSVELFINDGEEVFTSRIFPHSNSEEIRFFAEKGSAGLNVVKWELAQAVNNIEGND